MPAHNTTTHTPRGMADLHRTASHCPFCPFPVCAALTGVDEFVCIVHVPQVRRGEGQVQPKVAPVLTQVLNRRTN